MPKKKPASAPIDAWGGLDDVEREIVRLEGALRALVVASYLSQAAQDELRAGGPSWAIPLRNLAAQAQACLGSTPPWRAWRAASKSNGVGASVARDGAA